MATTYTHIGKNKWKSFFLIGFFVVLVVGVGALYGWIYPEWSIAAPTIAVLFTIPSALLSYFVGDKIALFLNGAKPLSEKSGLEAKKIQNMVENLSITAGLPAPKVYIINDPSPNAFATGRNPEHGSIALTTGLIERLKKVELEGVIAHELSHIGNYDILFGTIVVILVGLLAYMSQFILRAGFLFGGRRRSNNQGSAGGILMIIGLILAILAPIIAQLIKLAVSRKREYLADASSALLTRYPEGLASALEKIADYPEPMRRTNSATMHLYLAGTQGKKNAKAFRWFSTHPPIEDRIKRLREMGN